MGAPLSAPSKLNSALISMQQTDYNSNSPFWEQFQINDFVKIQDEEKVESILLFIKNKKYDNFDYFIKSVVTVFFNSFQLIPTDQKLNYTIPLACQFLCLLISVSGDISSNSPWFRVSDFTFTTSSPITILISTFSQLADLSRPAEAILSKRPEYIEFTKVLLFLFHAASFRRTPENVQKASSNNKIQLSSNSQSTSSTGNVIHEYINLKDHSSHLVQETSSAQFQLAFNTFPASAYLKSIFQLMHYICTTNNLFNEKNLFFLRVQLSLVIPCIFSCTEWQKALVENISLKEIYDALTTLINEASTSNEFNNYGNSKENIFNVFSRLIFSDMIMNPSFERNLFLYREQLIGLFLIVLHLKTDFVDYLDKNNLTNQFILAILSYSLHNSNEESQITFFHTMILSILFSLTSNLSSVMRLNEPAPKKYLDKLAKKTNTSKIGGTIADLLIETILSFSIQKFSSISKCLNLIIGIISNLSTTTVNLSISASNFLFHFLRLFFNNLTSIPEYDILLERLFASIFGFIRYQTSFEHSVIKQLILNIDIIERASAIASRSSKEPIWRKYSAILMAIAEAAITSNPNENQNNKNMNNHADYYADTFDQHANVDDKPIQLNSSADSNVTMNKNQISLVLHNRVAPVLAMLKRVPDLPKFEIRIPYLVENIWHEWFRIMLWQLFPDDAQFYQLKFTIFNP